MKAYNPEELAIQPPPATTIKFDMEGDNVLHYAALPDGQTSIEPVTYPDDPVKKYPFELDEFQKCAVACVHNNESVLVSAHTSAGKTVIAKYAIAVAIKNGSRVVYTSPIKALSNQKFNELVEEFGTDVGLLTGDVVINPTASILVMTTEILRMMLFTGDALIRELSWVIYDEVHYMKDRDRGVVWEESIIMLPDAVRFVFLSATIPNAREFSEWVAQEHHQVCHVVYTEHRPVPLRYYLAPFGDPKPYLVRDADGEINDQTFALACSLVKMPASTSQTFKSIKVRSSESAPSNKISKKALGQHTCRIIEKLYHEGLYPMIVFVFSRRECERLNESLGGMSFTAPEERDTIAQIYDNAMMNLSPEDRNLPQVESMRKLVERGIGVHHGGLMPIVKEIVEILFQYHLIKVLFATETFSMGLNMPAKTVVFNSLHKFDGSEQRLIATGEFIQMSGRAGRRNRDKFGAVVVNYAGDVPPPDLRALMTSAAQPLNSEFRVTYNMLLNLLGAGGMTPKMIMRKSFHQFQVLRALPGLIERRNSAIHEAEEIPDDTEGVAKLVVEMRDSVRINLDDMRRIAFSEENARSVLVPGRIVKLKEWGFAVILSTQQKDEVTVITIGAETDSGVVVPPSRSSKKPSAMLVKVGLYDFEAVAAPKIDGSFDSLTSKLVDKIMKSVQQLEKAGMPLLDPKDFIRENLDKYMAARERYSRALDRLTAAEKALEESGAPADKVREYIRRRDLLEEAERLSVKIKSMERLANQADLDAMIQVLKRFEFLTEEGIVTQKGRAASCINSADEIVITQLIFDGWFTLPFEGVDPRDENEVAAHLAALMTAFVGESSAEKVDVPKPLEHQWAELQRTAQLVATTSQDCGMDVDVERFIGSFSSGFMELALAWARGESFAGVMSAHPGYYEGSVIRTMKRLDELINQCINAAKKIDNTELITRLEQASSIIKKGVVSIPSLYQPETNA